MSELVDRVARADASAIGEAAPADVAALSALIDRDPSWQVREIAAYCLSQIDDPQAQRAIVPAFLDENSQVRAAAVSALSEKPLPELESDLFDVLDRSGQPFVRYTIARMLGRIETALEGLAARWPDERDDQAREGYMVALARLGDPEARGQFVAALHGASDEHIARFVNEHLAYLHDAWLLPALEPLLDRETPVVFLADDDPSQPPPLVLRACDVVVNLVASITGARFSFEIARVKAYSDDEIEDVRAVLRGLPPAP